MNVGRGRRNGRQEVLAGQVLGLGVWASAACLALGLALRLAGGPPAPATTLLTAGLLLLMATPALRVVAAVAEAVRARDWISTAASLAVALVLAATVVSALTGR